MGTWTWDPVADVATHDALAREILDGVSDERTFQGALRHHLRPEAFEVQSRGLQEMLDPTTVDPRFEAELEWRHRSGEWCWIQMTGETVFSGEGATRRPVLMVGTVLDVTTRKNVEHQLEEANREKDRYLATVAHELRNPLGPLRYAAELLSRHGNEEVAWARQVVARQVSHLTRLVDDLLDTSRMERGQLDVRRQPIDLGTIIQAALDASRADLQQHGQTLSVTAPPEAIIVDGDEVRLTQVVTNLLTNAAKFSTRPGTIHLSLAQQGRHAVLRLTDTGGGIAGEDLPHVFDLFYRSTRDHGARVGGLGVGLYLVRRLVELHHGTVEVTSEGLGHGATFTLTLPVRASSRHGTVQTPDRPLAGRRRRRRVLVADDDRDSADTLAQLLRERGNEVTAAYAGDAAVEAAAREKPDVALLDLGMPGMDGFEVCRRIRRQPAGRRMFIVALTGWGRREDREQSRAAGFDEFLMKPVEIAVLQELLERRSRLH